MQVVSAKEAITVIRDGWTLIPGGFGSCGHPDALTQALRERFLATGYPQNLTYLFAAGPGDKAGKGLDAIAVPGLVQRAIGGFWGLSPALANLARNGAIEAHNWPQGVISKLFTAIAGGAPGVITQVGCGTFVDPENDGGVIDSKGSKTLIQTIHINAQRWLLYPTMTVNCALLRGTSADPDGNISFEEETSYMDALAQALAVKRSGGTVIVQVKRQVKQMAPQQVRIPGLLVDFVVLAQPGQHPQTYGCAHDPRYTGATPTELSPIPSVAPPLHKTIVAHRAALELGRHPGANVNLGIGIPALIGPMANKLGIRNYTLTVESGLIGGIPDEGLSFGASRNPSAVMEQSQLFDFYDGGGIDVAFLGFAQVDGQGNVNVSRFDGRLPGSGGFINISQSAKKIVFCGTYTAGGLITEYRDNKLVIVREGRTQKLQAQVSHLTFNAKRALAQDREVMLITERAVFRVDHQGLVLCELAPGITIADLRAMGDVEFHVSKKLKEMPGPWRDKEQKRETELFN